MTRITPSRSTLRSIASTAARAGLALTIGLAASAHADWAVNDREANDKLREISDRIGSGDLNKTASNIDRTTTDMLKEIRTSVSRLDFPATLTPKNQLQKISNTATLTQKACPGGSASSAGGAGSDQPLTSLTSISAGDAGSAKQKICQELIQLRVMAFNDSIEMANRFEQYSAQLASIDSNRNSAKTQGDLWANTNESLRTLGKLQAEMGFWRTRLSAYEAAIKFHESQQNSLTQSAIKGSTAGGVAGINLGQLVQTGALAAALAIK